MESRSDIAFAHSLRSLGAHFPSSLGSVESEERLVEVWLWLLRCMVVLLLLSNGGGS